MKLSTTKEQPPAVEAKAASDEKEETAITVKEAQKTEKAPVSNYWVSVHLSMAEGILTPDSGFFHTGRPLMGLRSLLASWPQLGQGRCAIVLTSLETNF